MTKILYTILIGYSKYGTIDRLYRGITDIIKVKKIIKEHTDK